MNPTEQKDGGPAFPQSVPAGVIGHDCGPHVEWGMSLRDWFAGQAIPIPQHVIDADPWVNGRGHLQTLTSAEKQAWWAYQYADAMLAARAKHGSEAPPSDKDIADVIFDLRKIHGDKWREVVFGKWGKPKATQPAEEAKES